MLSGLNTTECRNLRRQRRSAADGHVRSKPMQSRRTSWPALSTWSRIRATSPTSVLLRRGAAVLTPRRLCLDRDGEQINFRTPAA